MPAVLIVAIACSILPIHVFGMKKTYLKGPRQVFCGLRGDRFWSDCTIGDFHLKVGQDSDGVLWVSPSPRKGIRFTNDATQLPQVVSLLCAINSMIVPRLVEEVLSDFNLHSESSYAGPEQKIRTLIWARLKPGTDPSAFVGSAA
jgi:hypothetical protein